MQGTAHRIRSQRWAVRTDSAEDAFAWRRFLRDHGEEILLPVLEKAFDEAAGGDRVFHIPRIEIKIRISPEDSLTEKLPRMLLDQLRNQLRTGSREELPSGEKLPRWPESAAHEGRFMALVHYLRTGSVPWHAMTASASDTAVALAEASRTERPRLLGYLRTHSESAPFYFRLLQILPPEEGLSLVHAFSDRIPEQPRQAVVQFVTSLLTAGQKYFNRHAQLHLTSVLLSESLSQWEGNILPGASSAAADALPPGDKPAYDQFISSLPEPAASLFRRQGPGVTRGDEPPAFLSPAVRGMKETLQPAEIDSWNVASPSSPGVFPEEPDQVFSSLAVDTLRDTGPEADLFPLTVHQAGLVLLHPFITRFFENTGVKEKGNPQLSFFALPRAAALLYFIATGREEVYEFELGFVKVLLGLLPQTPLPVGEGLFMPEDREEAQALLQSVIGHWSVLKNTSIQGLRFSFLDRQALLREEEEGWRLQVERKPFDMLLDHLPWGISTVRLPWMKRPIYTEW
jgi:hypothetical protein